MNFYTVAAKILKEAEKAKLKQEQLLDKYKDQFGNIPEGCPSGEDIYNNKLNSELEKFNITCDLGIDLMNRFAKKINTIKNTNGERWYFITVRPPNETINFNNFKSDCENFCNKWKHKWLECEYVFEQKGEDMSNLGFGFHWHMRFCTDTINYYNSHILRDLFKSFPYVAKNCIKVESIKSLERCIEYMNGDKKSKDKEPACAMDIIWREQVGIPASVKYISRQANLIIDETTSG